MLGAFDFFHLIPEFMDDDDQFTYEDTLYFCEYKLVIGLKELNDGFPVPKLV